MTSMGSQHWDDRYAASDAVWSTTPNIFVEQFTAGLHPGTVLDLGAGEGRNSLWLAEQGWTATAVDFSAVALDRARVWAEQRLADASDRLTTVVADLLEYRPTQAFDLVLVIYIHLPATDRGAVLRTAAAAVAPGGSLLVVAHHSGNFEHGHGGPQNPALLYDENEIAVDLVDTGLEPVLLEAARRPVQSPEGQDVAIDAIGMFRRPSVKDGGPEQGGFTGR